jgi:hypothetical protein
MQRADIGRYNQPYNRQTFLRSAKEDPLRKEDPVRKEKEDPLRKEEKEDNFPPPPPVKAVAFDFSSIKKEELPPKVVQHKGNMRQEVKKSYESLITRPQPASLLISDLLSLYKKTENDVYKGFLFHLLDNVSNLDPHEYNQILLSKKYRPYFDTYQSLINTSSTTLMLNDHVIVFKKIIVHCAIFPTTPILHPFGIEEIPSRYKVDNKDLLFHLYILHEGDVEEFMSFCETREVSPDTKFNYEENLISLFKDKQGSEKVDIFGDLLRTKKLNFLFASLESIEEPTFNNMVIQGYDFPLSVTKDLFSSFFLLEKEQQKFRDVLYTELYKALDALILDLALSCTYQDVRSVFFDFVRNRNDPTVLRLLSTHEGTIRELQLVFLKLREKHQRLESKLNRELTEKLRLFFQNHPEIEDYDIENIKVYITHIFDTLFRQREAVNQEINKLINEVYNDLNIAIKPEEISEILSLLKQRKEDYSSIKEQAKIPDTVSLITVEGKVNGQTIILNLDTDKRGIFYVLSLV